MDRSKQSSSANSTLDCLPNELLFEIFPYLPLKSLIVARGVSRKWRTLVLKSNIPSVRRKLLDFYLSVIESPSFLISRERTVRELQPFDQERFLNNCFQKNLELPEYFELYVREWPAKAVVSWVWPGLRQRFESGSLGRLHGYCPLVSEHSIEEIYFPASEEAQEDNATPLHALQLWDHGCAWFEWLICDKTKDKNGRMHFGEVYVCEGIWVEWRDTDKPAAKSFLDMLAQRVKDDDRCLAKHTEATTE